LPWRTLRERLAERRLRRRLRGTPRRRVAELAEDTLARISGVARPLDAVLDAPLTGRACIYYFVWVDEQERTGRAVRCIASEQKCVPFLLDDEGVRAIVEPIAATIWARFDHARTIEGTNEIGARERELFARQQIAPNEWWTKRLLLREAVIELDERIAVVGAGVREPDPSAMPASGLYRDEAPTLLRLTGSRRFPLVITDDPESL